MSESEILSELLVGTCGCGKVTTFKCHELWGHPNLTPCHEPLCGVPCEGHRHAPGTMGYVGWSGQTDYRGDVPDGPGFMNWLRSVCRSLFWSPQRKAQSVWDAQVKVFPPPAPLPKLRLLVRGIWFESDGPKMVEVPREKT